MKARPGPSLAELRAVVQPDAVLARSNAEHWTGTLYMRRLSLYLTWLLVRTPITANGVTALMIVCGFLAGPALLLPGIWGPLVAALLAQLQMFFDCCDGEVARWRGTSSPRGVFLDQIGHFLAEGSIGLFLGLRAAEFLGGTGSVSWQLAFAGALLLAGIWFNKALNQMVVLARSNAGLGMLADTAATRALPRGSVVAKFRSLARFIPFHRIYHSIEMTLIIFVASLLTLGGVSQNAVDLALMLVFGIAIWLVILGHWVAIWKSSKLDA